jgi:RPC5 protein
LLLHHINSSETTNPIANNNPLAMTTLHLVPLIGITHLRPNFSHFDQETALQRLEETELIEQQHATPTTTDDRMNNGADRRPLALAFQEKGSERAALALQSSYALYSLRKSSEQSEV